jgi:hypothetical protein
MTAKWEGGAGNWLYVSDGQMVGRATDTGAGYEAYSWDSQNETYPLGIYPTLPEAQTAVVTRVSELYP